MVHLASGDSVKTPTGSVFSLGTCASGAFYKFFAFGVMFSAGTLCCVGTSANGALCMCFTCASHLTLMKFLDFAVAQLEICNGRTL